MPSITLPESRRQSARLAFCALSMFFLGACGGTDHPDPYAGPGQNGGQNVAVVTGRATYDFVPTSVTTTAGGIAQGRLDYARTVRLPVRHALVELVSEDGRTVFGKTTTGDDGSYSIDAPAGVGAYVRVAAHAVDGPDNAPAYSIDVRDNTAPEYRIAPDAAPLYSMRGSVFVTAANAVYVGLHAGAGWTGDGYGALRTAAPFAILDQTVTAAQKLRNAAPGVPLPPLHIFWSVNNRPDASSAAREASDRLSGNNAGLIGTSHYEESPGKGLYILGAENVDTDEYDTGVIVHEFGHYVEANLSRSDSIGGSHSNGNLLDMRVAFGEGFGNAFSSIMRETPAYSDTMGPKQQAIGVYMLLDRIASGNDHAWYNEQAIGNFLYRASQAPSIGFTPIYRALLAGQTSTPALTSVFSFATALRLELSDTGKRELDSLLAGIRVQGGDQLDAWGTATAFDGDPVDNNPSVFPVYLPLAPGRTVAVCTTTRYGVNNKLGNRRHLRVTVPAAGAYLFDVVPGESDAQVNYILAYANGRLLEGLSGGNSISFVFPAAGDYVVDVTSDAMLSGSSDAGSEPHCIDVTMQSATP